MRLTGLSTSRSPRRAARVIIAATAFAAATSLAIPAAHAAPAKPESAAQVDQRALDSMGAFAPAIIGSVATPGPDGKVNADLLNQARALAEAPGVPTQVQGMWQSVMDFIGEPGRKQLVAEQRKEAAKPGDPEIPQGPSKPKIQEFLYPTLGIGCQGGPNFNASMGRALVTAGPQAAPAPGPKRGQAGYVYTSLGTGPAINNPSRKLWVNWLNIDTGRTGQTQLKRNEKINVKEGPGTFTAIAKTGKGRVISAIYGDVTTKTNKKVRSCTIAPTIGLAII